MGHSHLFPVLEVSPGPTLQSEKYSSQKIILCQSLYNIIHVFILER